MEDGN